LSLTGDEESLVFGDSGGNVIFASLENSQKIRIVKKSKFHDGIVLNCEISKDKKHVVTSSTDHSMKIFSFDEETGTVKEIDSFHQNNGWVWGLRMLNNMTMFLAVSSDSYITVWDIKESKLIKETENDLIDGKNYQKEKCRGDKCKNLISTKGFVALALEE
jgi:WD40 repeat protein